MSKNAPPSEARLPAVLGDSSPRCQSTRAAASATAHSTLAAAVAATSPTDAADAGAVAAVAIVSKVSLSISFHIIVYIV